jgi:hypothetical protein
MGILLFTMFAGSASTENENRSQNADRNYNSMRKFHIGGRASSRFNQVRRGKHAYANCQQANRLTPLCFRENFVKRFHSDST